MHIYVLAVERQSHSLHLKGGVEEGMFAWAEIYAIVQQFYAHRPCDTPKCDMNTLASALMKTNKIGRWVSLTIRWGIRKSSS